TGDEHRLERGASGAEVVHLGGAGVEVVLVDRSVVGADVEGGRVAVAVGPTRAPLVHAGELDAPIVVHLGAHHLPVPVEVPALERGGALVGPVQVGGEDPGVAHQVDDDAAGQVVGVEGVEDVAGGRLEPDHVLGRAVEGQQAD